MVNHLSSSRIPHPAVPEALSHEEGASLPVSGAAALIADPRLRERESISELLSVLGLGAACARTGADALTAAADDSFSLALISVDLTEPCGYEVLHRLRSDRRPLPIAMLSALPRSTPRDEVASLLLGADEFFTRPLQPDRFLARVRRLINTPATGSPVPSSALTGREREVLALLADGLRTAEIAELLCITKKTASTHIERILAKLGVHSQAQAVALALREGSSGPRGRAHRPLQLGGDSPRRVASGA